MRQKPLVVALAFAGLVVATDLCALGLGRLHVSSALGQPLVAEVEVKLSPGEDFSAVRAAVASRALYAAARLEYQPVVATIQVTPTRGADGRPVLRLTTTQPINEPYLDLLIEVTSPSGRLVREFVFLLDPPGSMLAQAVEPVTPPALAREGVIAPRTPAAAPQPAAREEARSAQREPRAAPVDAPTPGAYLVRRGDTLSGIARRHDRPGVSLEQLMIAIQRANPEAFVGGNINRLKAGVTLRLPEEAEVRAIDAQAASAEVRAQAASWRAYVARLAETVPTVTVDAPQAAARGQIRGSVTEAAGPAPSGDRLRISQAQSSRGGVREETIAMSKAIAEQESRARQLEKTKQDLERALALKNQTLASAQEAAKAAAAAKGASPAPPAMAPSPAPATAGVSTPTPAPTPAPAVSPSAPPAPPAAAAPATATAPSPTPATAAVPAAPPAAAPAPAPAAAAPAPPSVAAAAQPAPPTPAAEESFLSVLGDNPLPLAGGALALLGGLGALVWLRRRRESQGGVGTDTATRVVGEASITGAPDTVFGTSGLGVVKSATAPVKSQFSRSGMGTIDAAEVDPLAEAEVYIAYGREAQAEEILREALVRDPKRPDIAAKLAELVAQRKDRAAFDRLVEDIRGMERGVEYAAKLQELEATHFGTTSEAAASVRSAPAPALDRPSIPPTPTQPPPEVRLPSADDSLDFVLDGLTLSPQMGGASAKAEKSEPPVVPVPAGVEAARPAATAPSLALDFAAPPPAPAPASPPPVPSASAMPPSPSKKTLEDELAQLEASLRKATASGQMPDPTTEYTDFSTATPTNLGAIGPAMKPEMLDLSFEAGPKDLPEPTPSILDGQWHDAATKLDLAKAYEEMGDREGAREILQEVLRDGDEQQKNEARALLARLGG
ncbi:MAG: LysM peptidoglycan-binding domain-containing protein [Casimicrobiaceae bacterium]|nr:LysM peptidoglycan-binding domain-containing protein [Casimicrobiaceae bacterium]